MKTSFLIVMIILIGTAYCEDPRYERKDILPDAIDKDIVKITIDTAFSGSHVLILNRSKSTVGKMSISPSGRIDGAITNASDILKENIKGLGELMKAVKVDKDKIGHDGYTIEFADVTGSTKIWCPESDDIIADLKTVLDQVKIKYFYSKIDGVTVFYPGALKGK